MRSKVTRWGALLLVIGASLGFAAPANAGTSTPSDPAFIDHLQWNLEMIGAPAAWPVATGSGVTIAVVDSGVDLSHEDLQKGKIVGHVTCIGANDDQSKCKDGGQDDNGHGTHVAGIAAAVTDNETGVAGTAPDASILDVKVLGSDGSGTADDVAAGIKYAADSGAAVINLSLGNTSQAIFGPAFDKALTYAFDKGAIPVVAAGNDFLLPSGVGNLPAIVVGALDRDRLKASYGNTIGDATWALMAPGGSLEGDSEQSCKEAPQAILSTYLGGYVCMSGTSMAAPHVSGAAAVLRSMGMSQQETIDRLLATARPITPQAVYGAGALDLAAAVGQPPTQPPPDTTPDQTTAPSGSTTNGGGGSDGGGSIASAPSGDLGGQTSTSPPVINLPNQRAAAAAPGRVTARAPTNDDLSPGLVAVAVLMAAGVGCGAGWFALRGSNLARRTPPL